MQAACRGLRARKLLRIWSACALKVEASARRWLGVTAYARARGAAIVLQTASRRWAARSELCRARAASIRLQAIQRTRSVQRVFMLQRRSASLVQAAVRRYADAVLHNPRVTKSSLRLEIVRLRQQVHLLTAIARRVARLWLRERHGCRQPRLRAPRRPTRPSRDHPRVVRG